MFSSLRSRLWLTYALNIAIALVVVAGFLIVYLLTNPLVYRETRLRLAVVITEVMTTQGNWANLPPAEQQAALARLDKQFDVRLLVVSPARQVIADSRAGLAASLETRPFFRLLRLNQTVTDAQGQPWLYALRKLDNGNILVCANPRPKFSFWNVLTDEFLPPLMWSGALALIVALFIAFWMARWVADPLQRVINATRQFSGSDAKPLPLQGPQEVQELVGAFNQMTSRVQAGQQSQREFVANVSHELKTPLTSIQGFSQALLDGTAVEPADQKQAAQIIFDEAARMHRMVLGLLELARLDSGIADLKRETLNLSALLNSVSLRLTPQAHDARVTLKMELPDQINMVGDGDRLSQVFNNLIDNAIKFTPAGGTIVVAAVSAPDSIKVTLTDTGPGIPAEALTRIFDRFYQLDSSRQGGHRHGAGLGLAIAQEIVRAHGGKIEVQSELGQGTKFIVTFQPVSAKVISTGRQKK